MEYRINHFLAECKADERDCFDAGVNYANNGANNSNCHFKFFTSKERTKAWELGRDSVKPDPAD